MTSDSNKDSPAPGASDPGTDPADLLIINSNVVLGGTAAPDDLDGDQYRVEEDTAVAVRNGVITWIGPSVEADVVSAARTVDAAGMLLVPGLINTHNHLFQNLVKGLGDEMYLLPWVESIILRSSESITPAEVHAGALLGCVEALHSGTTALMDFMFGLPDPEHHRAVLRAIDESGLRGFMGRATRELNFDSGSRDPWYLPLDEVFDQMRDLAREFPSELAVPSVLPAPGTVRTMTTQGLQRVKEFARSENMQITIHMGEHTEEREQAVDRFGMGVFAKAEEIGFLGPDVVAAHCVKVDADELDIMARTGMQVSYNPVSNFYLGNGTAPVLQMLNKGVDVSLATDGGACGNTQDMLEALKFGVLIQKGAAEDPRVFGARDILRLATVGGARALGLPDDLGAIALGRRADFFLYDQWQLKTVPVHDPLSSLVWASSQANVRTVIVNGEVVLSDGRSTRVDEREVMEEAQARAMELAERVGTSHLVEGRRFTPFNFDTA